MLAENQTNRQGYKRDTTQKIPVYIRLGRGFKCAFSFFATLLPADQLENRVNARGASTKPPVRGGLRILTGEKKPSNRTTLDERRKTIGLNQRRPARRHTAGRLPRAVCTADHRIQRTYL